MNNLSDELTLSILIKKWAIELGFDLVGFAKADTPINYSHYINSIENSYHAEMEFLSSSIELKKSPTKIMPECKSVICLAIFYNPPVPEDYSGINSDYAYISRYALGMDYHLVLNKLCKKLIAKIKNEIDANIITMHYVDTGPIIEKSFSSMAGLGWIGKNTLIINDKYGSYMFLSEILINLELEYDKPSRPKCGNCRICIDSCPTKALIEPYILNSQLCISYHTNENRGNVPNNIKSKLKTKIYGCDICQEVCPYNNKLSTTSHKEFFPKSGIIRKNVSDWLSISELEFKDLFRDSPLKRLKYIGFSRNINNVMQTI